jgi:hypothetical protein
MKRRANSSHLWQVLCLATAAVVLLVLASAAPASAAPPANTISETDLNTLLQSGPVSGYFLTVLGGATLASQQPSQIPVTVEGIVPDAGPAGDLILFQATGSEISALGGIAEGMSGSPLYVDDGGTYLLAGAASYGDYFTTQNLGLATPIDDMTALESTYFSGSEAGPLRLSPRLATPVGKVSSVLVASSRAAASKLHVASGTALMAPLACVQIEGLIVGSPVYEKLAARFTALGLDVSPLASGPALDLPALPTLTAGSSLGMMYSDGDLATGGLGTVTYVDPANQVVVAFGHPLDYLGAVSRDMTNAWVQGIWSDSEASYKLISPVDVVGQITQDRGAGVAGTLGAGPVEVPVSSSATLGSVTKTAASTVTQDVVDNPNFAGLPSAATAVAMQQATDTGSFPGSALTTTTITVSDASGQYTIQRSDVWDDSYDVMSDATGDIDAALATLTSGLPGLAPKVDSINFSATLSATHAGATIEDVTVPGGLKVGANHLIVTLLSATGTDVQVPLTLTIPRGTAPSGTLSVYSAVAGQNGGSGPGPGTGSSTAAGSTIPQTLAQVVAQINAAPTNSELELTYMPSNQGAVVTPINVFADTHDYVVTGEVDKNAPALQVALPKRLAYDSPVLLSGLISPAAATTSVQVYEQPAGLARRLVATLPATLANDGSASFFGLLPPLKTTTRLSVVWAGDAGNLGASEVRTIAVAARISLSAGSTVLAGRHVVGWRVRLTPTQGSGRVLIERLSGRLWLRIADQAAAGPLSGHWRADSGSYTLRAVFTGSALNAAATSQSVQVMLP